jgi:hypothetical protein
VKKHARAAVARYGFDASKLALLPDKKDPAVGEKARALLDSKGAFLHAEKGDMVR